MLARFRGGSPGRFGNLGCPKGGNKMKHAILGVAFAAALAVPAFAQDYSIMAPANPGGAPPARRSWIPGSLVAAR